MICYTRFANLQGPRAQVRAGDTADLTPTMHDHNRSAWLAVVYAGTILVSAFLLFQVQPLISKYILPWFGGSPAVWTTCMFFFQTLLFCGYAYAHFSEHFLKPFAQSLVHLGLIAAALLLLPIAPDATWKPTDGSDPTWRIVGLLAITVGLPYFVLSSTGPLVQAWFSRTYPDRSPYRLYALSNIGSLAALLSYPFYFEPAMNVGQQAVYWSAGFVIFGLLCGYGAIRIWTLGRTRPSVATHSASPGSETEHPTPWQRVLWIVLPAFASLMLLATTNQVCQNVAVIPFLWVVPLSLYLLSFIICFDHERWYLRRVFAGGTAIVLFLVANLSEWPSLLEIELPFASELLLYFAALFGICMLCHGELVRLRPAPRYLTSFYLMISAGGALGGLFVSLIAPRIFTTFFEWKIGLVGGFALAVTLLLLALRGKRLVASAATSEAQSAEQGPARSLSASGVAHSWPALGSALKTGLALASVILIVYTQRGSSREPLAETRNFYGEVAVVERASHDPYEHDYAMFHGSIIHGVQFARPEKRKQPTTYYSELSGVGRAVAFYSARTQMRVGAVGLGVGTLAVYPQPGQVIRFYEINPEVVRLAKEHFTFLEDCRGKVEIVLGDARLSLEQEPPQRFDLLVLDAFSGDAVPSHLLTREAFEIYLRHLASDGAIAVHITNTYLDLAPVVRALAEEYGLQRARIETEYDEARQLYHADWMLLTRNEELISAVRAACVESEWQETDTLRWTDDHSNLFEILK